MTTQFVVTDYSTSKKTITADGVSINHGGDLAFESGAGATVGAIARGQWHSVLPAAEDTSPGGPEIPSAPDVLVPEYRTWPLVAVLSKLSHLGLVGNAIARESETVPDGYVIEWDMAGLNVPKGSSIDVIVSKGPHRGPVTVPDPTDVDLVMDGHGFFRSCGLQFEAIREYGDTAGVRVEPAVGTVVPAGTRVRVITVEPLPAANYVTAPSGLVGMTSAAARSLLTAVGATGVQERSVYSPTVPAGVVVGTSVGDGGRINTLDLYDGIWIAVSAGPSPW